MKTKAAKKSASLVTGADHKLSSSLASTRTARRAKTIARLAVQLAREDEGVYATARELARIATNVTRAAFEARDAVERKANPGKHYAELRALLSPFGAEVVDRGDINGMVVGVRFSSGRFTSGSENLFYLA